MPIYEFKCLKCEALVEMLQLSADDEAELKCPTCGAQSFERVMSATNYSLGAGNGQGSGVRTQSRTCSGGSCTTYEIPGHSR